ncbi:hypothetical protein DFH08DRAFT_811877 [Mycena albidolilacea]|uniref:Uncharacterized protein n=1 Tax=Mycena albidolilacea TaxID=1033008 RepID=A0AAD7EMM0_9AGAR|nr:hypothetical protein DFH08DRAFT_811877 [Mycena albidolilacea]
MISPSAPSVNQLSGKASASDKNAISIQESQLLMRSWGYIELLKDPNYIFYDIGGESNSLRRLFGPVQGLRTADRLNRISKRKSIFGKSYIENERPENFQKVLDLIRCRGRGQCFLNRRWAAVGVANHARIARKLADPKYRALYIAVARLFAQRLLTDWRFLLNAQVAPSTDARNALLRNISLAPKTPSRPSALENNPAPDSAEATDILRSFYRRWLLAPLRDAAVVTERFVATNRWTEIPYNRVRAVCMKNDNERFFTRDPDGFQKYLISVEKGQRTISGATLLPHELIADFYRARRVSGNKYPELLKHRQQLAEANVGVIEAQWKTLVQSLRDAGTIDNSIAICDVSGSRVYGPDCESENNFLLFKALESIAPIFPAISLSLLLAQLAKPPFNDGFITFSHSPEFVRLDPAASLHTTVETMSRASWQMNTDLRAVFPHLLLPLAIENKVRPQDMIKRVFVFSDMQFDLAARPPPSAIERTFTAAGYEVPQIVYWNLSQFETVEVMAEQNGVALMSGFSPSMLKIFMGEEERESADPGETKVEFNPLNVMKKALSRPSFDGLVVVD